MYLTQLPRIVQWFFPRVLFHVRTDAPVLYLTFDDGPIPEVTPWVLEQLREYNAKATFFCLGKKVWNHPELYRHIRQEGHSFGHHTFSHSDGWATGMADYMRDVKRGNALIRSKLFRPPYGRLTPAQYANLMTRYRIVMWDILTGDFDNLLNPDQVFQNAMRAKPGSILVFHDSLKSRKNLKYALPKTLEHFSEKGYWFEGL